MKRIGSAPSERLDSAVRAVQSRFPFAGYMGRPDVYRNIARTVERHLPEGSRILDFGSGPCDKTAVLQQLGYRCSACDDLQDDWHRTRRDVITGFARDEGIDFHLVSRDLPFSAGSFDMVMMHDVLEHLVDSPRELIASLINLLRDGGLLFVTVPNAGNIRKRLALLMGNTNLPDFAYYYWLPGPWRGHIREYVRPDLVKLADFLGLRVLELRSCHHMLVNLPPVIRPPYRFVTNVFPGWRDTWLMVAQRPTGWQTPQLDEGDVAGVRAKILGRVNTPTPE
jgi:SAM-dependent methyltransferase